MSLPVCPEIADVMKEITRKDVDNQYKSDNRLLKNLTESFSKKHQKSGKSTQDLNAL